MNKFKNFLRFTACAGLAAAFTLGAVGCNDNPSTNNPPDDDTNKPEDNYTQGTVANPETRPLVLSTQALDGVFNPFFSTSTADSNIIAQTQLGMLSTDKNGNIVYGENEPTVVKDYSIRTYKDGSQEYTDYQFVIKNGIKFSDGVDLTIKDVLFNLYVYLDPVYTGSATMYSTKIVGLNEYRTQNPNATDNTAESMEATFTQKANERIDNLITYVKHESRFTPNGDRPSIAHMSEEAIAQANEDFVTVGKTFREELLSDWNNITSSMDSYIKTNGFTAAWQVFLVNDGAYDLYKHKQDETLFKDENGNYLFDPDSDETKNCESELQEYLSEHNVTATSGLEYEQAVRDWAIETVYNNYFGETVKDTSGTQFEIVSRYWGTASTILTNFTAEAKSEHFSQFKNGLEVPSITGITTAKGTAFKPSSESSSSSASYGSEYDVLQIKIKGVDPKAIYNFSFSVAPLHYYSSSSYESERTGLTNYIDGFNEAAGNFGVAFGETNFMNTVVNSPDKIGVPVGAGVYKATNSNGDDTGITRGGFSANNMIYFKRNDYFTTVGEGINNAKIRLLRYQVVNSDQIVNALNTDTIDFGDPSATSENAAMLDSNIKGETVWTNGYGYVGINARFVPNINVRRAIIKAMNRSLIVNNYYRGGYAEIIQRSMSTQSWAYPETAGEYVARDGTSYEYDSTGYDIQALINSVGEQGYYKEGGIYTNGRDKLDYTFTIAGGSTDHPAYQMFLEAAQLLNSLEGIHVNVVTSQTALTDLTSGKLTVWAAAWTSTIDPDMYQVYHKDSTAASVKNWGYDYIMADKTLYSYEWSIIQTLSNRIDDGRSTTNQSERKGYYATALDLVMELAVEFPTYQRKDLFAYNSDLLQVRTMQSGNDLTPYNGPLARIWEVNYK